MSLPTICQFPVSQILSDPDRFQSRAEYPRDASEIDLSNVPVFSHDFAECLRVWRDPRTQQVYVVDGHKRLDLARRTRTESVLVLQLDAETDAEAFAIGVVCSIGKWIFNSADKVTWAAASRRAAVDRALHTGWLDPRTAAAKRLFEFYPDLERRYCDGE